MQTSSQMTNVRPPRGETPISRLEVTEMGPEIVPPPRLWSRLWQFGRRHDHLIKYFIIGSTASAIDVGLFLVLFNLVDTSALFAHSISVPTSVVFSFTINAVHNFRTTDHIPIRFASFVAVAAVGYLIGAAVIIIGHDAFGLSGNIAKILSLPLVFAVQYLLNSRISFRKTREQDD